MIMLGVGRTVATVLIVILIILVIASIVLYRYGKKLEAHGADRDSHHFGDCFDRAVSVREEARSAAGTAAADH